MKRLLRPFLLPFIISTSLLAGCKKDSDTMPSLAGTWQLTSRVCYCAPEPLPKEMVKFTDSSFTFYKDGQPTVYGNYTFTTAKTCGGPDAVPVVRFAYVNANSVPQDIKATLSGNKLVLDYGGGCLPDAPVATYERL